MKIVFQGDSVTDAGGRIKGAFSGLGSGYVALTDRYLREKFPEMPLEIINRGISGNETSHLVARWQEDTLDLQPDILSLMIGINDIWHAYENQDFPSDAYFEANLRQILTATKEKTHAKIILLEPYALPNDIFQTEVFRRELGQKIDIIRKLAREFADAYVPLDGLLHAQLLHGLTYDAFTEEGVHPTPAGAEFIARACVSVLIPIIDAMKNASIEE